MFKPGVGHLRDLILDNTKAANSGQLNYGTVLCFNSVEIYDGHIVKRCHLFFAYGISQPFGPEPSRLRNLAVQSFNNFNRLFLPIGPKSEPYSAAYAKTASN